MAASAVYSDPHISHFAHAFDDRSTSPIYVQVHVCQASREHHVARELGRTIMITKLKGRLTRVFSTRWLFTASAAGSEISSVAGAALAFCEQEKSDGKLKFSP